MVRDYKLKNPFADTGTAVQPRETAGTDLLASSRQVLTVAELTRQIHSLFESSFAYGVWVEGELSDPKVYPSGHLWFSLKDADAALKSVMWRDDVRRLKFEPEQGLKVICFGRVEFYAPRGEVKFSVRTIEPKGMGALQLAFEQLKEKLAQAGLFDEERKRPLPDFPERVGLITAPSGAAIDDMLKVLREGVQTVLRPTRVQGERAADSIAQAIEDLNRRGELDLLIVGRGGGSLEDLWAFNEEVVARAIFKSRLPVISAVGHEKDVTISDLVADFRAATPTKAAEIVTAQRAASLNRLLTLLQEPAFTEPERWLEELQTQMDELEEGLLEGLQAPLVSAAHRVQLLNGELLACSPQALILHEAQRLDGLHQSLKVGITRTLEQYAARLHGLAGRLHALSPLAVLERGYSITFDVEGLIIKEAAQLKSGDLIQTRLHRGRIHSEVKSIQEESHG